MLVSFQIIMKMIMSGLIFRRSRPKSESQAIRPVPSIIILIMLAPFAVQTSSCDTTATVTITAVIPPAVEVSRSSITWDITPMGQGTYSRTERVVVKANTDWQLLAEDCDPATSGHLAEWTGTGYGSSRLHSPVRIATASSVSRPIEARRPVEIGTYTGEEGQLVNITLTQDVIPSDRLLPNGQHYRIVVKLKASPVMKHTDKEG